MKVQDLIEKLSAMDLEGEVLIGDDWNHVCYRGEFKVKDFGYYNDSYVTIDVGGCEVSKSTKYC